MQPSPDELIMARALEMSKEPDALTLLAAADAKEEAGHKAKETAALRYAAAQLLGLPVDKDTEKDVRMRVRELLRRLSKISKMPIRLADSVHVISS